MNLKSLLRPAAVLLAATALAGCLDVDQKIVVDKGELAYTAQISIDAKLAAMSDKKGGICGGFAEAGGDSMKVQVSEAVVGGNVVCTLSAKGPIEKFATFAAGDKEASLVNVSRASEGAWRIDSSFDMKEKAGANPMMEGMMQAMLAGRTLSWTVTVPKVLETNGQLGPDGKSVTWSVPLASAYKDKQSFYVIFKAERPWYAFILDLIDAIKKLFASMFAGSPAPAPAAPAAPAPAAAPAAAPAPEEPKAEAPAAAPAEAPAAAAPAPADTGPITASFDCAKASSTQEKLICGDRDLARLDVDLSAAYRKARDAAIDPKALQADQLQWLKSSRNACADKACLVDAYKGRLAQLSR